MLEKEQINETTRKTFKKTATINEKTYYLSETDLKFFEEHLRAVANQIEAFEKCDEEVGTIKKTIDFNNPVQLFQELKDNAIKIEAYPQLIMILQKLSSISNKKLFISFEEIVKEMQEIVEKNPEFIFPSNFQKLLKDSQKHEELESKFETLQLTFSNQEKLISKLIAEKIKELEQKLPEIILNEKRAEITPSIIGGVLPTIIGGPNNRGLQLPIIGGLPPPIIGGFPPPIMGGTPPPTFLGGPPPLLINLMMGGPPPPPFLGGPPPPLINLMMGGPPPLNLLKAPGLPSLNALLGNKNEVPPKEKKKPNVPLKNLMWNMIPGSKIKETVWEKVDDSKIILDIEGIEKEFMNAKAKPIESEEKETRKKEEIYKISLLPPEKSKNIEIVLGKLKLDLENLAHALLNCDEKVLNLNTLESLIAVIPNETDLKPLKDFEGEREYLANPEKFLLVLTSIPGFYERLQAMKFSCVYEELLEDLDNKLEVFRRVWGNIQKNEVILNLLEYILAIGNYLNGTSIRGGKN